MAAIAYVTDEKMIEFHRCNGSQSIVFWRLSAKNFQDFKQGDLLFFLAKDLQTKQSKEKGLMGYGRLRDSKSMSVSLLWKKYGNMTGYNSKKELIEAITKSSKSKTLPKKINCLLLDKVFFFQSPIYLSQFGFNINSNLESFTYLDRHEGKLTLDILQQASKVGLDFWSGALVGNDEDDFNKQLLQYSISTVLENAGIEYNINSKYLKKVTDTYFDEDSLWINQARFCFLKFKQDKELYMIFYSKQYELKDNFYKLVGQLLTLKEDIEEDIKFTIISNRRLNDRQKRVLNKIDTTYLYYSGENDEG
jgi:hypothetical protein